MWARARNVGLPAAALVAAAQVLAFAGLAATGSWHAASRDLVLGGALTVAEAVLVWGLARMLGGPRFALWAAAVWVLLPVALLRYWVAGGGSVCSVCPSPPTSTAPFSPIYHDVYLSQAFGVHSHAAVAAACLLLVSCLLALLGTRAGGAAVTAGAGAAAGAAAGGAALVDPHVWPALAAPALCLLAARRFPAAGAALAAAGICLALTAAFRSLPAVHAGYHAIEYSLLDTREFSWSARMLEYLPLAGLVGVGRRSLPAAAFLGWLLLAVLVLPLGNALRFLDLLIAERPGLPVYALLVAAIPFLWPRNERAPALSAHARP